MKLINNLQCVKKNEKASDLAAKLLECEHSGFPVVNEDNQLIGSITRRILAVVLEYHFDQDREGVNVSISIFYNICI